MEIRLPSGWTLIVKEQTVSTNEDVKALPAFSDKTVVCAEMQTAGRGRIGRRWDSPKGNLYLSVCVELPDLKGAEFYSFLSALALSDAIQECCPEIEIRCKWPNDLLIKGKKVSGILLETNGKNRLIVGMGVNIVEFPADKMLYPATSLKANGCSIRKELLLETLIRCFDFWQKRFQKEGKEPLLNAWRAKAYGIGGDIIVNLPDRQLKGTFDGLDNDGCLLLNRKGEIIKIMTGDVFFRFDEKE